MLFSLVAVPFYFPRNRVAGFGFLQGLENISYFACLKVAIPAVDVRCCCSVSLPSAVGVFLVCSWVCFLDSRQFVVGVVAVHSSLFFLFIFPSCLSHKLSVVCILVLRALQCNVPLCLLFAASR